jgi:hypothetical protein
MEKTMPAKLAVVATHPNRSKSNVRAGANPTPAQVRRAREDAKLTLEQAGELVFTSWRTWQNWEADKESAEHRRMHPTTWESFQVKLNALRLIEARELSPSMLQELGLHIPEELIQRAMGTTAPQK